MVKHPKHFSYSSTLDHSIEGFAFRLDKSGTRIKQLSPGPFLGRTAIIEIGDITLTRRTNTNRHCSVSRLPDEVVFVFPLTPGNFFANGRVCGKQHQLASSGHRETYAIFPKNFDQLTVAFPLTSLHRYLLPEEAALFVEVLAAIESNLLFDKTRKATLTANLLEIFSRLTDGPSQLPADTIESVCKQVVALLFDYLSCHKRAAQVRSSNHEKILQRALTLIEANPARMFNLDDLAREIFASKRCIQYAFSSILGLTPMRYIKKIRLNLIRQELNKAGSSSGNFNSIVAKYSFTNAGRISKEYADFFGERPRDIQRRHPAAGNGDEALHD